jgi:ribonuclease Z
MKTGALLRVGAIRLLAGAGLLWAATVSASEPGDGALRVTFLGTGAPRPSFERYGPSILLEAGDERLLVDAGWGLRERLLQAGSFDLITGIDHVLLTHLHYDHTIGLADLWLTGWLYGRRTPLRVEGPIGTTAMMEATERTFRWDVDYRVLVGVPRDGVGIEAKDISPGVVYERGGLKITAFEVEHMPIDLKTRERLDFPGQTLGYRIDYRGHSVVLSGDTRPSENVVDEARGVDVLVHEVQVPSPGATPEANLANVSLSVHSEPEAVAKIFERARPKLAVYSHIIPPEVTAEELLASTPYAGRMVVAHDLMMVTVGDTIEVSERPRLGPESFEKSRVLR